MAGICSLSDDSCWEGVCRELPWEFNSSSLRYCFPLLFRRRWSYLQWELVLGQVAGTNSAPPHFSPNYYIILSLLMTYFVFLCSLTKQIFRRTKESRDTRMEGKSEGGQSFPFFSSQNCRFDDTLHHHLSPFTSSCSSLAIPLSSVLGSPRVTHHVMSSCLPRLLLALQSPGLLCFTSQLFCGFLPAGTICFCLLLEWGYISSASITTY